MARNTTPPKSGPVPIAGVMLYARAIIEQGRTKEFIAECEELGHYMRAQRELLDFVREFVNRPLAASRGLGSAVAPMSTRALERTRATARCDNTFKRTAG